MCFQRIYKWNEQSSKLIIRPHSEHSLFSILMTGLRPWPVVWSLNKADFPRIFELVGVLIRHIVLCLRIRYLIVVLMRLKRLLLGVLRLWISGASNLVWGVLCWVDLLTVSLVWMPVNIWIVRTVVVSMWRVLELTYHILLVRCGSIRLVVERGFLVREVA